MTADLKPSDNPSTSMTQPSEPEGGAARIFRGTRRMLLAARWASLAEVTLLDGHRADIMAINDRGEILGCGLPKRQ